MRPPEPPAIVGSLITLLCRLRDAVADAVRASGRGPRFPRFAAAWVWLGTTIDAIARLAARQDEGQLRPRRPHAAPAARPREPVPPEARRRPFRHPFGWLAAELEDAAPLIAEIEARLADPAFQARIEAEPARFGRLLRPLCRALGLAPPAPIRKPAPRAAAQVPPASSEEPPFSAWPRRGHPVFDALSPKIA